MNIPNQTIEFNSMVLFRSNYELICYDRFNQKLVNCLESISIMDINANMDQYAILRKITTSKNGMGIYPGTILAHKSSRAEERNLWLLDVRNFTLCAINISAKKCDCLPLEFSDLKNFDVVSNVFDEKYKKFKCKVHQLKTPVKWSHLIIEPIE